MEVLVLVLAGTLILVVVAYLPLLHWAYFASKKDRQIKEEMIKQAEKAAAEIISQAQDQAKRILAETHGIVGKSEQILENKLAGIVGEVQLKLADDSDNILREYTQAVNSVGKYNIESVQKTSNDLREIINKQLENERGRALREISDYRQERFRQIDANIFDIIKEVMVRLFGTELSWKRDVELIQKALIDAKSHYEKH